MKQWRGRCTRYIDPLGANPIDPANTAGDWRNIQVSEPTIVPLVTNPHACGRCLTGTSRSDHQGEETPENPSKPDPDSDCRSFSPLSAGGCEHPWQLRAAPLYLGVPKPFKTTPKIQLAQSLRYYLSMDTGIHWIPIIMGYRYPLDTDIHLYDTPYSKGVSISKTIPMDKNYG